VLDQPQPGWTFHATTSKLDTPIQTDDGLVSQAVTQVRWTAAAGGGIKPGQFDQFVLSMGPLPKVDSITFRVIQAYSDGTKVSWIDVPAPGSTAEPEHPAPVLALAPADSASGSSAPPSSAASAAGSSAAAAAAPKNASQTGPVVLGVVALVVAAVAVVTAALALARSKRQVGDHT
jgi:uncharacterized protein